MAYNSRIDRPNYQDMAPYLFYYNPYYYYKGNPYLKPQFTKSVSLTHIYKEWLSTGFTYSHTKNAITQIAEQDTATRVLYYTNENIRTYDNFNLSVILTLPVTKWWTTVNTVTGFYDKYRHPLLANGIWGYLLNSQHDFRLNRGWQAEITEWYNSKGIYGITTVQPVGSMSLGVKKEVLKKKGSILLNINDLFWSEKYREHASFLKTNVYLKSYSPSRRINLSFSYRFGRNFDRSGEGPDEMKRVQK